MELAEISWTSEMGHTVCLSNEVYKGHLNTRINVVSALDNMWSLCKDDLIWWHFGTNKQNAWLWVKAACSGFTAVNFSKVCCLFNASMSVFTMSACSLCDGLTMKHLFSNFAVCNYAPVPVSSPGFLQASQLQRSAVASPAFKPADSPPPPSPPPLLLVSYRLTPTAPVSAKHR